MNISYEQIRAFVSVAELGSFSAAARQLNRHRTTLGQVINNLEIETNLVLFDRTGKFPVLTDAGTSLYTHAKNLAEYTQSFEHICQSMELGIETDITIYHSDLVPMQLIADVMMALRVEFKDVNVHWLHRNNQEVKQALGTGEADLGVVFIHDTKSISAHEYVYLASMPFCLCAASNSALFENKKITINELKKYRQLMLEDYFSAGIDKMVTVSNHVQRIENMSVFLTLLASGEGWALVPKHAVSELLADKKLTEFHVKEVNTTVRFPLAIWTTHQSKQGPVRGRIMALLAQLSQKYSI
ncbi:LysR family transcriptional regulator [Moritella sp. Urea-trap-13]|uniref:LysR family transcriptional regulator n=1 Tax=Moritella sp. Urea-trap-13 TaxID=2058327 RepID=UPI000C32CCC4|nr:LysR family transcriptional regulator [Moritella sp. Urea-trap-13]PKH09385.1 LysR family transcriptional regulator [Moritella sp. Urea-trap-13]